MDKCIACGLCAQKCPKKVDDPYNVGISKRKAIYLQYSQTVPLKYAIDRGHLPLHGQGQMPGLRQVLPHRGHQFRGYRARPAPSRWAPSSWPRATRPSTPRPCPPYGYGHIADVVTGLEYERLLSAGGPYHGPPGAALGPQGAQEGRLDPVRRLPQHHRRRQQLLLHGLLHVRGEAGPGHRRAPERRRSEPDHLLHGPAQP